MRNTKNILDRKNAKAVLEILKDKPTVTSAEVARATGMWYNVANYLVKELRASGLVNKSPFDLVADRMNSKQASIIKTAFLKSSVVENRELLVTAGVSRLTDGMKHDINLLIQSGFVNKVKEGTKVSYKRV